MTKTRGSVVAGAISHLSGDDLQIRSNVGPCVRPRAVSTFLPRDAMHKRGLCRHAVSVRVCVSSVAFVDSVKTSNRIFKIFVTVGSQAILVFKRLTLR